MLLARFVCRVLFACTLSLVRLVNLFSARDAKMSASPHPSPRLSPSASLDIRRKRVLDYPP